MPPAFAVLWGLLFVTSEYKDHDGLLRLVALRFLKDKSQRVAKHVPAVIHLVNY